MKVKVIGCGNAFNIVHGNSSYLLEEGNKKLLIDCGFTTPYQFAKHGINVKDITDIYISHAHADHIGGLEYIAFSRYDWMNMPSHYSGFKNGQPPRLIANDNLMNEVWENSLKGGLKTIQTIDATLDTFFETMPIKSNTKFYWCGWEISLVQMVHIVGCDTIQPTFGLIFNKPNHQSIFFTTDTQFCTPNQVVNFYNKVDVIFQDCELVGVDGKNKIMDFSSGVHANYGELAGWESANNFKLSKEIKGKMWLTHYQSFKDDNKDYKGQDTNWDKMARDDGFCGFVKVGQEFNFVGEKLI